MKISLPHPVSSLPSSPGRTLACIVAAALLAGGCATSSVGVKRMDAVSVHEVITANALTNGTPSIESRNVLFRTGLKEKWAKTPETVLAELHRLVLAEDNQDVWFALAELSFLHGERTHKREYAIMASLYAWSFLFGGPQPDPFDPRLRVATDLYNRGLTEGMEGGKDGTVLVRATSIQLPIGRVTTTFDEKSLEWNGRHLEHFIPVAELSVTGLEYRFRSPGIGAPLAANATVSSADSANGSLIMALRLKTPVTALVRIDDIRRQIRSGDIRGTLELHTDPGEESISIAGREVQLEKEPSAALAALIADIPINQIEFASFLGTLANQQAQGKLITLRPHVPGRIPVVFVHGTASSPARWAEMVNVLDNDPRIRDRFEPWFFVYTSSSPVLYSSYLLRKALKEAVASLDPSGADPSLRQMVVIGHSQGGLLTKMTSVHSGDAFWRNISSRPFESVRMPDDDRAVLRELGFVEPLPFVSRVVFVCTPHRGSFLAGINFVRSLITRLVTLPMTVTRVTTSLLTMNPEMARIQAVNRVNAVDNMNPSNPFIRTLSSLPIDPRVKANSIVAVLGDGPVEEGDDGVVKYASAHIEPVESEKIVNSSHSTQAVPATIAEVRRILLAHAAAHPAAAEAPATAPKVNPAGKRGGPVRGSPAN
jgi:pimeloyl-ACP methyl ester carboxylesterase